MHLRLASLPPALLAACTCNPPPTIDGRVVDPWDRPVVGAEVRVPGLAQPLTTDSSGAFVLPMQGAVEASLSAEGWIPASSAFAATDTSTSETWTVTLYPEPPTPGFHLVGAEGYVPLPAEPVVRLGSGLEAFQGIRSAGDAIARADAPLSVVFHTALKLDEIARLDIELHRLQFIEEAAIGSIDGDAGVDINLWTSGGRVPMTRTPLGSRANYLFTVDTLAAGTYAFSTLQLLDAREPAAFDRTPPAIRKVHAFTAE